ncbi:hypothetical protein PPGU19_096460 (plasmid) [Paraburkholderia sp. PGU19]|nr:hypothetical protein PPGU19_096460 [Paraburkholderia sp. PGU19]
MFGLLPQRIVALLADGSELTAIELAERLDKSRNDVLIAKRGMLADDTLQVTRYIASAHGGRGARVFACTNTPAARSETPESFTSWPPADPVLTTAIHAIVRLR